MYIPVAPMTRKCGIVIAFFLWMIDDSSRLGADSCNSRER